jgi:hypothetical protein
MLFIFSTPVLIGHLWQLKTVVFLHWCLIFDVLLNDFQLQQNKQMVPGRGRRTHLRRLPRSQDHPPRRSGVDVIKVFTAVSYEFS